MDINNGHGRPNQAPQFNRPIPTPVSSPAPVTPARRPARRFGKRWYWGGGIVLVLIIAALVWWLGFSYNLVNGGLYQAVFLNNGQVYFGKLHDYYTNHPYLTDVYYIQSQNGNTTGSTTSTSGDSSLVELGSEIHKPQNLMILNKDAILFVENMQTDSQVSKLIISNDKNGGSASAATTPSVNVPTTTAPSNSTATPQAPTGKTSK